MLPKFSASLACLSLSNVTYVPVVTLLNVLSGREDSFYFLLSVVFALVYSERPRFSEEQTFCFPLSTLVSLEISRVVGNVFCTFYFILFLFYIVFFGVLCCLLLV